MPKWMDSARDFLGLGEDPYYDDDYDLIEEDPYEDPFDQPEPAPAPRARPRVAEAEKGDWDDGEGGVRMIRSAPGETEPVDSAMPAARPPARPDGDRGVVRPLPGSSKPEIVSPSRFDDVQEVADAFKRVQPVIMNLQGVDRELSRRLIDFASGLCYGLEGEMERVADQVFLLTPRGAEVSADDRRRFSEGDLDASDT